MDELFQRQDQGGIARLQLSRADAYNSLSMGLMQALIAELNQIAQDISVRVVIIDGAGKGFCAGHDLKEVVSSEEESFHQCTFDTCSELMQAIVNLPVPVIAKVHGVATAAGCQLVASCDLAYAGESSRFGTPGVNIGLFCSTPMVALSRVVSQKHAMELLLTGQLVSSSRAQDMGLINQAVPDAELDQHVEAVAAVLASKSRKVLEIGKTAYYRQREMPLKEAYTYCGEVMVKNMQTEDAKEGIGAFIEKRKPQWKHR